MHPESPNGDTDLDPQTEPTAPFTPAFTGAMPALADEAPSEPQPALAEEPVAPGADLYLRRWTFVFVVAAVWVVSAVVGLGLFYWWFHSISKTPAVFIVLVYVVMCTVAALIAAMAPAKPWMSAVAVALMSAPFASTAAAAVLYGVYFCEHASRCFAGVLPY